MTVEDEDVLYRRVRWLKRVVDMRTGEPRPSSDSFRDATDPPSPMSGILRSSLVATERSVAFLVPGDGGDALLEFDIGELRRHGFDVVASPTEDEPAHTHVIGDKSKRSTRRLLADLARWTVKLS